MTNFLLYKCIKNKYETNKRVVKLSFYYKKRYEKLIDNITSYMLLLGEKKVKKISDNITSYIWVRGVVYGF